MAARFAAAIAVPCWPAWCRPHARAPRQRAALPPPTAAVGVPAAVPMLTVPPPCTPAPPATGCAVPLPGRKVLDGGTYFGPIGATKYTVMIYKGPVTSNGAACIEVQAPGAIGGVTKGRAYVPRAVWIRESNGVACTGLPLTVKPVPVPSESGSIPHLPVSSHSGASPSPSRTPRAP